MKEFFSKLYLVSFIETTKDLKITGHTQVLPLEQLEQHI